MNAKQKTLFVLNTLEKKYGKQKTSLTYKNVWQLLVATILSAQCTDKRVNTVTKKLFKKFATVNDFAWLSQKTLEKEIYSTGFYHNKAKNILVTAKLIKEKFNGKVPNSMKELLLLPGIARKTANIVLSSGFGKNQGIAVDTHVKRLSNRIGLTENKNPEKIEQDLMQTVPKNQFGQFSLLLIKHGRETCKARKPNCAECVLSKECINAFKF